MRRKILQNVSSLYVHYPFCKRKCHYCDFPIQAIGTTHDNLSMLSDYSDKYIHHLLREIDFTFQSLNHEYSNLKSLYIGGGTPSLIPLHHFELLVNKIKKYYNIDEKTEFSIECDPGTFDLEKLNVFTSFGVNRVSLGIQSTNDQTLKRLGRSHDLKDVWDAIETVQKVGKFETLENVSFDLIMGLPHEELEDFMKTLNSVLAFKPGHLSIYLLTLENNTVFTERKKYSEGIYPLPKIESLNQMYRETSKNLASQGYNHYEVSTFSLGDKTRSVHNSNYWIGDSPFHAFGMGAASFFSQVRFTRPKSLRKYFQFVESLENNGLEESILQKGEKEELYSLDWLKSVVMGRTRTCDGLKLEEFCDSNNIRQLKVFLQPYIDEGYIEKESLENHKSLVFTRPEGFLFSDEITSSLFMFFEENFSQLNLKKK